MAEDKKNDSKPIEIFRTENQLTRTNTTAVFRAPQIIDPDDLLGEQRPSPKVHIHNKKKPFSETLRDPEELEDLMFSISPERLSPVDRTTSFRIKKAPILDRDGNVLQRPELEREAIPGRAESTPASGNIAAPEEPDSSSAGTLIQDHPVVLQAVDSLIENEPIRLIPPPSLVEQTMNMDAPTPLAKLPSVDTEDDIVAVTEEENGQTSTNDAIVKLNVAFESPSSSELLSGAANTSSHPEMPRPPQISPQGSLSGFAEDGFSDAFAENAPTSSGKNSWPPKEPGPFSLSESTHSSLPAVDFSIEPDDTIKLSAEADARLHDVHSNSTNRPSVGQEQTHPEISQVSAGLAPQQEHGVGRAAGMPSRAPGGEGEEGERYEKITNLGIGQLSEVSLARDHELLRLVAMKRLKKNLHNPTFLEEFAKSARKSAQLEHPGVAPLHDVGIDEEGRLFSVMKHVEGESMAAVIETLARGDEAAHERYPFMVRNQIFLKIMQTIQFAHHNGMIHCDLKPSGVVLGSCGEVTVMGWDLAKDLHASTPGEDTAEELGVVPKEAAEAREHLTPHELLFEVPHDSLRGTPAYMSPEQAAGKTAEIDERSDIYSLGVLYYEWMGLLHYQARRSTVKAMLAAVVRDDPRPLHTLESIFQGPVPREFSYFVMQCLAKSPRRRFHSVDEMIDVFQLTLAGQFEGKCAVTWTKRALCWLNDHVDPWPRLAPVLLGLSAFFTLYGALRVLWSFFRLFFG